MRKSLDSIELRAVVLELADLLGDAHLQKLAQLSEHDYWLTWSRREPGGWVRRQMLLCLRQDEARLHLSQADKKPPAQTPTSFTMLLRKHLLNKRLLSIRQPDLERLVVFDFGEHRLLLSIPGRENNLVLTNAAGKTLGAHNWGGGLRPGQPFQLPERPELPSADSLSGAQVEALLPPGDVLQGLKSSVFGLPAYQAKALARRTGGGVRGGETAVPPSGQAAGAGLAAVWDQYWHDLREARRPGLTATGKLTFEAGPEDVPFATLQEAAEAAWGEATAAPGLDPLKQRLARQIHKMLEKGRRRRDNLQGDLDQARLYARLQHEGDMLLAHQANIPAGASQADLEDWDTGESVTLTLDPTLNPAQNAQARYRTASRRKRGVTPLQNRLEQVEAELQYLDDAALSCEEAQNQLELDELARSLPTGKPPSKKKTPSRPSTGPRRYRLDGFDILVGRNPTQNEQLATRTAARGDLWFHAREIAGAHVVVKTAGREPGPEVLHTAAVLAARHSRAAEDTRVPVAYTLAQHLKKPPGSPPGKVTYRGETTVLVDPRQELTGLETLA